MDKKCNRCGQTGLVWKQSKKGNWYLAIEKNWQGDMGGVRSFYPAHRCDQVSSYEPGFGDNGRNESFAFDLVARSGA